MSTAANKAVFLSYASQDAAAVQRLCDALRAAGVEVWFDQNELVGGDAWDAKIRKQIAECALFVPVISAATQARLEGYFRLEWKLAAQRTHTMADEKVFLLPVVIDDTRDTEAKVPAEFKAVQWTRLPGGEGAAVEKFCARVQRLLGGDGAGVVAPVPAPARPGAAASVGRRVSSVTWVLAVLGAFVVTGAWLWLRRPASGPTAESKVAAPTATAAAPLSEARKLVAQARALFEDGDTANRENFVLAEELLKRAHNLDPVDGEVWAAHAQLSSDLITYGVDRSSTRMETLKMQAERAIKLAPASIEAQVAYAGYFRQSGRQGATAPVEEAVALLQKIVAQAPQHRRALRLLGMSFGRLQNYDDACAALDRANALPGGDSEALVIKAALHFTATGRYSEAEEAVARSLGIRVNGRAQSVDALLKLAWRGDLEGAAQAVALWPAWLLLEDRGAATAAEVAIWRRDWERALTVLRSVPRDYLSDYYFSGPKSVLMAIAHEMGRQPEAARREWENVKAVTTRMAAADPLAREFVLWKACALAKLGDTEEARRLYHDLEQTGDLRSAFWSCTSPAVLLATTLGTPGPIATKAGLDWRGIKLSAVGDAPRSALELNPVFDPVRATPAFQRLIESAPAPVPASSQPTVTLTAPAQPGGKSVAVLAFKNVGGDPANEAIVEGIGLELISVLGRVPGLTVRGNSSLNYFKGSAATTQEKGRKLNATYLVDGSVQRRGDTVNIVANLTLASTDEVVWSSPSLRREVKDIFAVQDEIARLIAENLSLKLGVRSASATAAINPLAFELYVQARQAWNLRTPEGHARAEQLLNRALALEPNFARAHAAMADVWSVGAPNGDELSLYTGRIAPEAARVEEKVKLALTLDPGSAEAHASLGNFYYTTWRRADAERELREAIRLNPSYASAHQWFGRLLLLNGRLEEALVELRQATELDPLSPRILDNYAWALIFAGRFAEAIQYCDRALALQDTAMQARALKAVALAQLGRLEEAVVLALTLPAIDSGYSMFRAIVYGLAGKTTELEKAMPGYEKGAHISKIAGLAASRRFDEALDALDPNWIVSTRADHLLFHPIFDPMRDDVRFKRALQTLGLTEAHARAQAWRAAHLRPILPAKK